MKDHMISLEILFKDKSKIYAKRGIDNWDVRLRNQDFEKIGSHEDSDIQGLIKNSMADEIERITVFSEDTILSCPAENRVIGFDVLTGDRAESIVSKPELEAILILTLCGDDVDGANAYYPLAERAIATWPNTVRSFP